MQRGDLIRFVTHKRHPPYGHRSGVFAVAYDLWREQALTKPDHDELRILLDWFENHLTKPQRFSVSRHPRADNTAISWLRSSAHEHMKHLRRVELVGIAGVAVEELRTARPGDVVYKDDRQVVALPFSDTPR